jgi:ABC-type transport system involved in multi-copper enzyme maturation permease subunit
VNLTLVIGLLRQRLASPMRATILALMVLLPPALVSMIHGIGLSGLGDALPIAMLFAIGMIGQDVSSGVLQLVLARPVRRWEYVISRWLSASLGASLASLAQIGLAWVWMASRGNAPEPSAIGLLVAGRELQIFGVVAVMALLSTLVGGLGDLALYAVFSILGGIVVMVGQFSHSNVMQWAGHELSALLSPQIELAQIAAGVVPWAQLATYASNVSLCLLLAVVVMNRKELSYASG